MYGTIAERAMDPLSSLACGWKLMRDRGWPTVNTHISLAMEIFLYAVSVTLKSKTCYSLLEWFVLYHRFVLRLIQCPVVTLNFGSMEYPVCVCARAHMLVHAGMHCVWCNGTALPSMGVAE